MAIQPTPIPGPQPRESTHATSIREGLCGTAGRADPALGRSPAPRWRLSPAQADHGESTPRFAKPGVQQLVINGPVITGDLQWPTCRPPADTAASQPPGTREFYFYEEEFVRADFASASCFQETLDSAMDFYTIVVPSRMTVRLWLETIEGARIALREPNYEWNPSEGDSPWASVPVFQAHLASLTVHDSPLLVQDEIESQSIASFVDPVRIDVMVFLQDQTFFTPPDENAGGSTAFGWSSKVDRRTPSRSCLSTPPRPKAAPSSSASSRS